jgi:predicted enzyme related to lactoylglutathione lyase
MTRFVQFHLRTTDVDAARSFYAAVLGNDDAIIFRLHEQAIARGAPPHWLGYLDVGDVDASVAAFVARGAVPLGPKWVNAEGLEAAVMRDPGGAVVALAKPPPASVDRKGGPAEVAWHLLHTTDVDRAKANYNELFGWELGEPMDLGTHGVFHPFAWQPGDPTVGAMSDIATHPGVHSHWLFHFRVGSLDAAIDAARAGGGIVMGPFVMPSGERIAVCDDPQGAAFALIE